MKKNTFFALTAIAFTAYSFSACKKGESGTDHSSAFKNTVWTGEFNYNGSAVQPLSIEFKEGGQLVWHELLNDYTGSWNLNKDQITISFGSTVSFKAGITSDNKLTGIQNSDPNGRILNNGALNTGSDEPLANTTWRAPNVILYFKSGSLLDMTLGPNGTTNYIDLFYTRQGKSIRYSCVSGAYKWFMVFNGSSNMKGANTFSPDPTVYPFVTNKQ
jgi:hypothetical protein